MPVAPAPARLSHSPLEPIFGPDLDAVPLAFREQFLHSPDHPFRVSLEGRMHQIWFRPGWLRPLFWVLGRLGILVPESGRDIPTSLLVDAGRYPDGQPYHIWDRTFQLPHHGPYRFRTTIVYDADRQHVADLVGPGDRLVIVWRARFTPPNTFTLDSARSGLRLGQRVVWMPAWLWPWLLGVVRFIQRADESQPGVSHIELSLSHPLFGDVFGYTGSFRARRIARQAEASHAR